ncbi:MAG TPA: DUF2336 domain-containing protein [Pseudolabrys sp.]|nr:DUF2336 domain-containing protein [Pseudolabrys sp.]
MVALSAHPLEGLLDLACREGVDIRPTLLRVLTDLYVQKPAHTDAEEAQYVELASRLIESVDARTRAAVRERLTRYSAAPAPVLESLSALDEIPAAPIAPALSGSEGPKRAQPIAPARRSEEELTESFFAATAEERRIILTNLDAFVPIAGQTALAASPDTVRDIETAALGRNTARLVRALERALDIRRDLAERVVNDRSGEPIVVAARALGMPADVLQRILLFINPHVGQSVTRVFGLAALFDEITPAAAEDMISLWRATGVERRARYEPALWHGERADPRARIHAARPAEARKGGLPPALASGNAD